MLDFDYPSGSKLGLIICIQNIEGICALPFSGYLSDLLGRRWAITIGILILLSGVILQVVPAVDYLGMFLAGRFVVGLGTNLISGSAPVLIMELAHPEHRGNLTTMYNCF